MMTATLSPQASREAGDSDVVESVRGPLLSPVPAKQKTPQEMQTLREIRARQGFSVAMAMEETEDGEEGGDEGPLQELLDRQSPPSPKTRARISGASSVVESGNAAIGVAETQVDAAATLARARPSIPPPAARCGNDGDPREDVPGIGCGADETGVASVGDVGNAAAAETFDGPSVSSPSSPPGNDGDTVIPPMLPESGGTVLLADESDISERSVSDFGHYPAATADDDGGADDSWHDASSDASSVGLRGGEQVFPQRPTFIPSKGEGECEDASDPLGLRRATMKVEQVLSDRRLGLRRSDTPRRHAVARFDRRHTLRNNLSGLRITVGVKDWLRSFRDLDPRFQILEYFNELSMEGLGDFESQGCRTRGSVHMPMILRFFIKFGIFSVWRPTSPDAISKMISGEGTGKGLDIKGKSAKRGRWSGFVPYLQIHDNDDKRKVGYMRNDKRVRVFYPNKWSRDAAAGVLANRSTTTSRRASAASTQVIEEGDEETEEALQDFEKCPYFASRRPSLLDAQYATTDQVLTESRRRLAEDPSVNEIDDYASARGIYGLDIPERLFWETYVVQNDISRPEGSEYDTGRPSMPEFQQMNIDTLRNWKGGAAGPSSADPEADPRPVLWHGGCGGRAAAGEEEGPPPSSEDGPCDPMCPKGLLMAYEENDTITPVVSDFDCFLLGTRGVKYEKPFGARELSMLSSCVEEIGGILATPVEGSSWTSRWLAVKKKHARMKGGEGNDMPKFGYADPLSYSMMTGAVRHLKKNGAVRHGPEAFNYGFPQELDDQYLVISDTFPGVPWRYANNEELIDILCDKIDEGFTFPLNPKWILCDHGWKKVYDKLLASSKPNVQNSLSIWYPEEIRRRMSEISTAFPQGFVPSGTDSDDADLPIGVRNDLAKLELERYKIRLSSKRKLRNALSRKSLGSERIIYRKNGRMSMDARGEMMKAGQCDSVFLTALKVIHTADQKEDHTIDEKEDHAVNKKEDNGVNRKEDGSIRKRRNSSITVDVLRMSTRVGSLFSSYQSSDIDGDHSENGGTVEAGPPRRRRSSASSKVKSLGTRLANSLVHDSNHNADLSDSKKSISKASESLSQGSNRSRTNQLDGESLNCYVEENSKDSRRDATNRNISDASPPPREERRKGILKNDLVYVNEHGAISPDGEGSISDISISERGRRKSVISFRLPKNTSTHRSNHNTNLFDGDSTNVLGEDNSEDCDISEVSLPQTLGRKSSSSNLESHITTHGSNHNVNVSDGEPLGCDGEQYSDGIVSQVSRPQQRRRRMRSIMSSIFGCVPFGSTNNDASEAFRTPNR